MKLYINEKVFSLHDKFYVYDENGNSVYEVSSKFPSYWKKTMIYDMDGSKLLDIKQVPLKRPSTYNVYEDGEFALKIARVPKCFVRKYELSNGYYAKGVNFPLKVEVYNDNDKAIGTVRKKVFSVGDKYEIEIFEERYELMMLAIAVAMAIEDNSTDFGRSY